MSTDYETDPVAIERRSFQQIRQLAELDHLSREAQQVAMRVVHSLGQPEVVSQLRFSDGACEAGLAAIRADAGIVCDVEMVRHGITRRLVPTPPRCLLNDPEAVARAKQQGITRSMAAIDASWPWIDGSIVLIGNAPTALFRLLEKLLDSTARPALVIGMPVGFIGAAESKALLWEQHRELGIECITLLGRQGGSAVTAASLNALLRCHHGEWY